MKNTFKVLGIIAFVAIIGFSLVSCENVSTGTTFITVVNNYTNAITKVEIDLDRGDGIEDFVGIAAGEGKTYDLETPSDASGTFNVTLYAAGLSGGSVSNSTCRWETGKTSTITLTGTGTISAVSP
jgi:hypothetical protein